jgi:hypothetical protein
MEARVQEALQHLRDFPEANVTTVAREYNVSRSILRGRLQGCRPRTGRSNAKLTSEEETAIRRHIDWRKSCNLAIRPEFVVEAADLLLRTKLPPGQDSAPATVGKAWALRFMKRYGYPAYRDRTLDALEDFDGTKAYFTKLKHVIEKEGIQPTDIWNMDETGFFVEMGKDEMVITKKKRHNYLDQSGAVNSATSIDAISAVGEHIPAFFVVSGEVQKSWLESPELEKDTMIMSTAGVSEDKTALFWAYHFNAFSAKKQTGSKRLLMVNLEGPHSTHEFIQYCYDSDIIPFGIIPDLKHLIQPMDAVMFQPLWEYDVRAVDSVIGDGCENATKLEFLSYIQQIRNEAFEPSTVKLAFGKTGIWPMDPQVVLQQIKLREPPRTPSPPPRAYETAMVPTPRTWREFEVLKNHVGDRLADGGGTNPIIAHNVKKLMKGYKITKTELALWNHFLNE